MKHQKHKVPAKLHFYRWKNVGFLTFVDKIIRFVKPSRKYNGKPDKILFIRNDKIGDAVITLPVLRDLKLNYAEIQIHVLCSEINSFVFNDDFIYKRIIYSHSDWKTQIKKLQSEKYDAVFDLVGTDKKFIWSLRKISKFRAGSRLFGLSWLYKYYLETNWVSENDMRLITKKIEDAVCDCFGFTFSKRDTSLPYNKSLNIEFKDKEYDILIHLGTTKIRKFDFDKEMALIDLLTEKKILITDVTDTIRFQFYRNKYSVNPNIIFKLYKTLEEIYTDAAKSRLLLCYDGGQAHFLSQFARAIVLVGSVLPEQWSPYEFTEYTELKTWQNGVKAIKSMGEKAHISISFPIWCNPCFGIGCNTRPCINNIDIEQVNELINLSLIND